jgi:hypothetical protein
MLPALLTLAACSGSSGDSGPTENTTMPITGTPDHGFVPAPHPAPPMIPYNGGPIAAHPEIVTITWKTDPLESKLRAFDKWLSSSDYFTDSLDEYGVHRGHQIAEWSIPTPAPATIDDSAFAPLLSDAMGKGEIPPPTPNRLYNIYVPSGTTVTITDGGVVYPSCGFAGYHGYASGMPYVVNVNCGPLGKASAFDELTNTASFDLAGAVTDPVVDQQTGLGTGWSTSDPTINRLWGNEISSLCIFTSRQIEGYWVDGIYSNRAAKHGRRVCAPAAGPMFGATPTSQIVTGKSGSTVTTKLLVYSTAPMPPVKVSVDTFSPITVKGAPAHASNGDEFTLTISLTEPAGQDLFYVFLESQDHYRTVVPIALDVK